MQSQNKRILPPQRIGKDVIRIKPTGEDKPAGRCRSLQPQEAPSFRQGPHPCPENWVKYPLPERTPPSAVSRGRATRRRLPAVRTKAPHRTRTRPSFPSFLRNFGPGSSGTLATPGPLALALHHRPGETS